MVWSQPRPTAEVTLKQCSGGSKGGAQVPPLFFDQSEARMAENIFLETAPPPLSQDLDDPPPPPSEGLDLPMQWVQLRQVVSYNGK